MNKKRTYLLIGLVTFIIGLAKFAPATVISQYLAAKTANTLLFTNAEGTIWHGNSEVAINADQIQAQGVNHPSIIGQIDWDIKGSRLFLGELNIIIKWNKIEAGTLVLTSNHFSIKKLNLDLPADAISSLIPSLKVAQLGGQLHISATSFIISNIYKANLNLKFSGPIQLDWQQASSLLSSINPLGRYHANFNGVNEQITIKVATLNGPLILIGDGAWSHENGLQFKGSVTAENSQKQPLAPLLHILGNESNVGSGYYKINISE